MLILLGLKQGVINSQRQLLLNDPCNLEIKMQGNGYNLSPLWFEEKANDSRIQFIIPVTRFLNNDISIRSNQNNTESVDLIPTSFKDPLLKMAGLEAPANDSEALITHALAQRLHLQKNDKLHTVLSRNIAQEQQHADTFLIVKGVLPEYGCLQRSAVLTSLNFLLAVEDYKQGLDVALFSGSGKANKNNAPDTGEGFAKQALYTFRGNQPKRYAFSCENPLTLHQPELEDFSNLQTKQDYDWFFYDDIQQSFYFGKPVAALSLQPNPPLHKRMSYARARIFVKTLEDVPKLADELRSGKEGMEIISKVYEIEKLKQLDRFLNVLLSIVALIGMTSGSFALGGSFLLSINGKRRQIAQMRLLGISKQHIGFLLVAQGIMVTSCAFIVIVMIALISQIIADSYGKEILNAIMKTGTTEMRVFDLDGFDYFMTYLVTSIFTSLVIVVAAREANKIHPGEQLREI